MNKNSLIYRVAVTAAFAAVIFCGIAVFQSISQTVLTDRIAAEVTPWYGKDQSKLATPFDRRGTIVRRLDFSDTSDGVWTTDKNLGAALPNGAIIDGGYIHVFTAVSPSPTNGDLTVVSEGDVYSGGTNIFASTGIKRLASDTVTTTITVAAAGVTNASFTATAPVIIDVPNATTYLKWDVTGTAAPTAGVVMVYLDYLLSNP